MEHLLCAHCGGYPCACDEMKLAESELEICPVCGKPEELWSECECSEPEDFGTPIIPRP